MFLHGLLDAIKHQWESIKVVFEVCSTFFQQSQRSRFSLAFWKFYRAYMDNKKPNLIWYTQIFMVASLINFVFFAIPDRSKSKI